MVFKNPRTGETKKVKSGFSWTSFFFGSLTALVRGDLKGFAIQTLIIGISWMFLLGWLPQLLIIPFMYNKIYMNRLLDDGWVKC